MRQDGRDQNLSSLLFHPNSDLAQRIEVRVGIPGAPVGGAWRVD
jgi:hypothetical protein